jgi:putative DNA primase/helicase
MTYRYHPVRDWLSGLRWDGESRLDRLLIDYADSPDTPYVREVSKNTIIAAVARVYQPGCQHDSMLVLEGSQGSGKTSFVRILGGKWYADIKIDLNNLKDTIQCMQGRWILEASELEFMKRNEAQAIKRFLTLTHDITRFAWARYDQEYPRQSIFIGTVNPGADSAYLSDTEGNRRYWPVVTGRIDLSGLQKDRDNIFAEAYHRYKNGEHWSIKDAKLMKIANEEAAMRVGRDSWQEVIAVWLTQDTLPELTGQNIANACMSLKGKEYDKLAGNRISKCMRNLGYERKRKRIDKLNHVYVWYKEDQEDYLDGL